MLEIKDLNKKFGKKTVLDHFSFVFHPGVYGLLGPNGAGKTTFLRCVTRVYPIKKDTIFFNGRDAARDADYLSNIGYLPQKFGAFKELKVCEMMQMMAAIKELDRRETGQAIDEALHLVNLTEESGKKVGALSGGMIRRLGIAQALLGNPQLLVFDEPTSGLDPEERLRFKNIISQIKGDRVVIISTHIVEDVEAVCDQVAVMREKNILCAGTCEEIENYADGKVYIVPERELGNIRETYHIQKYYEREGEKYAKILCSSSLPYEKGKPNVEDGYICLLKGV